MPAPVDRRGDRWWCGQLSCPPLSGLWASGSSVGAAVLGGACSVPSAERVHTLANFRLHPTPTCPPALSFLHPFDKQQPSCIFNSLLSF